MNDGRRVLAQEISEKQLQAHVTALLRMLGYLQYHTFDSRRSQAGFPDIIAVRDQRICAIELKSEEGKVTDAQRVWLDALADGGAHVMVIRPNMWLSGVVEAWLR